MRFWSLISHHHYVILLKIYGVMYYGLSLLSYLKKSHLSLIIMGNVLQYLNFIRMSAG